MSVPVCLSVSLRVNSFWKYMYQGFYFVAGGKELIICKKLFELFLLGKFVLVGKGTKNRLSRFFEKF